MLKRIVFTGGGSAGHVVPNLELIQNFLKKGWEVFYIGSEAGVEKTLVSQRGIPYQAIASGKLRRYFSWQNFIDPFRILLGIVQAYIHLHKIKPRILFSKGGFVAFPVVFAAWLHKIPIVAHESDLTPGLANKLSFPFASKICLTFPEAKDFFKTQEKLVVTGTPIRETLLQGDRKEGITLCGFTSEKPCLMVIGGGSGSARLNHVLRQALLALLDDFNIIHLCGVGKIEPALADLNGYKQFEYVDQKIEHLFAASDLIVSRSGANSVYEILSLKKPHLFVPLPSKASRGEQIKNAEFFVERGLSQCIFEENLNPETLIQIVTRIWANHDKIKQKLANYPVHSGTATITQLIETIVTEESNRTQ